jgi:hypothetical protein
LPRKTDSKNPADWLWIAETELTVVCLALEEQIGFTLGPSSTVIQQPLDAVNRFYLPQRVAALRKCWARQLG